jgi:PAS domain S-box-containing protein
MSNLNGAIIDQPEKNGNEFLRDLLFVKSLLASSNAVLIRAIDKNYRYLFFNQMYKNMMKRMGEADIAVGINILDSIELADDRTKTQQLYQRAFLGESFSSVERYSYNEISYLETFFYPISDTHEQIIAVMALGVDITDRKRTEEALRQSENLFKTLFMSLTDGFYLSEMVVDDHGNPVDYRYLEVNPKFEQILGIARDNIIGKRYKEIVPADTTEWLDNYCRVAVTGEPRTYEFYSSEYKRYFETYAYKTSEDRIAVFVRDVTERKRTEKALQNTQKLESLGILAGGIAHDFNNILSGLFGYIDLASLCLSTQDVVSAKENLSRAMQTLDVLKSLTNQLLTFSKGGSLCFRIESMGSLIENCCKMALSGSNIKCSFDIASDLAVCECDKNQIAQVLTNIVINAKQAMPSGGEICINANNVILDPNQYATLPNGGKYVRISIKDHGIGIPEDSIKNIFDPFFTTKETGNGLGLSMAFSIMQRHNGIIDVESKPGAGSTFHVFLPAATREENSLQNETPGNYVGRGPILVMDDDVTIRDIYNAMIQLTGHTVVTAANGEETVRLFKEALNNNRPFVMTFLDLTIKGGMGGLETLSELRKLQPDAIVIAVSGYANNSIMSKPLKAGFNDSISKPFTMGDITRLFLKIFRPRDL